MSQNQKLNYDGNHPPWSSSVKKQNNFKKTSNFSTGLCKGQIPIPSVSIGGILVSNICLISISNSVSDGATNKSVLNIESS